MRLKHARWLLAAAQHYGIGLEPGEDAEQDEAWFRVVGLASVHRPMNFTVESNVGLEGVADWERPLLTGVATELREALTPANDNQRDADDF